MTSAFSRISRFNFGFMFVLSVTVLAGCDRNGGGTTKTSQDSGTSSANKQDAAPLGGSKAETPPEKRPPVTAQVSDTTPKPVSTPKSEPPTAQASAPPTPPVDPPISATMSPGMESSSVGQSDDVRRAQAEDMIYATIRVKMEEMIAQRAKLLKEGKSPSDEQIRSLEGSIMRARDLLTEAGEIVEDVQPPIVQVVPKP